MKLSFNRTVVAIILFGIILRLLAMFFLNYTFDFFNILALVKSVADSGSLVPGWVALKRTGLEVQLYGKIYYQIAAFWLTTIARFTNLIDLNHFFDRSELFQTGPALYQLIAIKMVQFLYDGLLVFFLYKIARLFEVKKAHYILLFWAINPFLILVPYAWFQADFAMVACLTSGLYFWLASRKNDETNILTVNKILALIFFVLGGVIKQVPLIFIPFVIVSFSRNWRSFLSAVIVAAVAYFTFSQLWTADANLLKQMLFNSRESTAIFNFQLNSMSVFLFAYTGLFLLAFFRRRKVFSDIKNIIYLSLILMIIVYITEDSTLFFPQFVVWIMPLLAILYLFEEKYGWFFIIPIIGYLKRLMMDSEVLSGALKPSAGYGFNSLVSYGQIFRGAINPDLVGLGLTTMMISLYVIMAAILLLKMFNVKINDEEEIGLVRLNLRQVAVGIMVIYLAVFGIDFFIKSRYSLLPMTALQRQTNEFRLNSTPLAVSIDNPGDKIINAVELRLMREEIKQPDYTYFRFKDGDGRILLEQKVSDYLFPVTDDNFLVPLAKSVTGQRLTLEIYKKSDDNVVKLIGAKFIPAVTGGWYYDQPDKSDIIRLDFKNNQMFEMDLRGQYGWPQIANGIKFHINQNPDFFTAYFSTILLLAIVIVLLGIPWKKKLAV